MAEIGSREGKVFNMRLFVSTISVAVSFLLFACATPHIQTKAPGYLAKTELRFLKIGETPREDIIVKLGQPASSFEDGRILIYLISIDDKGRATLHAPRTVGKSVWGWDDGDSLVLVFREDGVLRRISVVGSQ